MCVCVFRGDGGECVYVCVGVCVTMCVVCVCEICVCVCGVCVYGTGSSNSALLYNNTLAFISHSHLL